jgi:plastocyanin
MTKLAAAAATLAAFVTLAAAGTAGAATHQVFLGEQGKAPAGTPKGATLNQFFPGTLQINVGDKVKFTSASFHTATFLGGTQAAPPLVPDPAGTKYEGINDSTGAPFFFNGLGKLIYNVGVFGPAGGTTVPGKGVVSTGVLAPGPNGKPVSATIAFAKAGSFKLLCAIHAGMTMKVVVKPKGAAVPSATQVKATRDAELAAAWAKAPKLAASTTPKNTVFVGVGTKTTLLAMVPKTLTVNVGTAVNFVNKSPSEPHNVVFGPKAYIEGLMKKVDLFPMGPTAPNQAPPFFVYGSEPPGGYRYDGSNHGNGFLTTPLTDDLPGVPPRGLPGAFEVTFTKAGKFRYFCLLHGPDMAGEIVVTP